MSNKRMTLYASAEEAVEAALWDFAEAENGASEDLTAKVEVKHDVTGEISTWAGGFKMTVTMQKTSPS